MSIWVIVIFVLLTIVGFVMVAIGFHEKTKHKDDPTGKPGKTYDILLYAGIALAVIGIIGLIWSMISYAKSKKKAAIQDMDMGPPPGYGPPPPGYGPPPGQDYGFEMSSMSQGPPPPPSAPQMAPQFVPLPDGRIYNTLTGSIIPAPASSPNMTMGSFGMLSNPSACNTGSLNLEEFMKAAKLLKELKDIING
jgi:hypothetical protein